MNRTLTALSLLLVLAAAALGQTYSNPATYAFPPVIVTDSIQRGANATTYAAQDAVRDSSGRPLTFAWTTRYYGRSGYITGAKLFVDTANTANGTFDLLLFSDTVATVADNAAQTFLAAYSSTFLGKISFTLSTAGTGSTAAYAYVDTVNMAFRTTTSRTRLYGILIATGAWVPKSLGKIWVTLNVHRF